MSTTVATETDTKRNAGTFNQEEYARWNETLLRNAAEKCKTESK